jgi:hypothetical protein
MKSRMPGNFVRKVPKAAMGGGVVLLSFLLFMLFRFGIGGEPGKGDNDNQFSPGDVMVTSQPASTDPMSVFPSEDASEKLTLDEKTALSNDVLAVLIDERNFLIELPSDTDPIYRQMPLERIVQLAQLAKGDSNGIQVRILRRESARASAEEELRKELNRSGIESDAIHMSDSTVP